MNLVCFRARSSLSWRSVGLFDVVGSLIGGNNLGRTVKSSARFAGLEGGLSLTLEQIVSSAGFRIALCFTQRRCRGGRGRRADACFLSIMVSVSEKDKLSLEDDGASLLILLF